MRSWQTFVIQSMLAAGLAASVTLIPAHGAEAVPMADDTVVEARLNALASELRCLVCQNETLADSRAELAEDLRAEIRQQIRQGKGDEDIMAFLVARYGDFVRYRPPFNGLTGLLWIGPFLLLGGMLVSLLRRLKARAPANEAASADKPTPERYS